jgi:hypothetical protein
MSSLRHSATYQKLPLFKKTRGAEVNKVVYYSRQKMKLIFTSRNLPQDRIPYSEKELAKSKTENSVTQTHKKHGKLDNILVLANICCNLYHAYLMVEFNTFNHHDKYTAWL